MHMNRAAFSRAFAKQFQQLLRRYGGIGGGQDFVAAAELTSAVIDEDDAETASRIRQLIGEERYREARSLQEFEGLKDALVWYVISSDKDNLYIVEKVSPVEMWLEPDLVRHWVVSQAGREEVACVKLVWSNIQVKTCAQRLRDIIDRWLRPGGER